MSFIPKRSALRALFLKLHLYFALGFGFLFALLGFTGSLCIYQEEIDQLLNPDLSIDNPQGQHQTLDAIMAAIQAEHPQRSGAWTLEMPRSENGMITAWFEKPRETFFEAYAPLMIAVNPYTAKIVSTRFWGKTFATWLLELHSQLLLGDLGSEIVGWMGILLSLSVITGLYLWWPGLNHLANAFKLRPNAGIKLLLFDTHRWLGLLFSLAILLLAGTGIILSFPKFGEALFGAVGMAHGETGKNIISTAQPNNHPTGLASAAFIARAPYPKAILRRVTTPLGETGIYRINLRLPGEINQRHPYTTVWIDHWSGQIREVRDPSKFSFGATLSTWIWPLHTGEALGVKGRFFWFITGQAIFFMYFSGLCLWLIKIGKLTDKPINYTKVHSKFWGIISLLSLLINKLFARLKKILISAEQNLPALGKLLAKLKHWLEKNWHYP